MDGSQKNYLMGPRATKLYKTLENNQKLSTSLHRKVIPKLNSGQPSYRNDITGTVTGTYDSGQNAFGPITTLLENALFSLNEAR